MSLQEKATDKTKLTPSTLKVRASKKLEEEINRELAQASQCEKELTLDELEEFDATNKKR